MHRVFVRVVVSRLDVKYTAVCHTSQHRHWLRKKAICARHSSRSDGRALASFKVRLRGSL